MCPRSSAWLLMRRGTRPELLSVSDAAAMLGQGTKGEAIRKGCEMRQSGPVAGAACWESCLCCSGCANSQQPYAMVGWETGGNRGDGGCRGVTCGPGRPDEGDGCREALSFFADGRRAPLCAVVGLMFSTTWESDLTGDRLALFGVCSCYCVRHCTESGPMALHNPYSRQPDRVAKCICT